MHKNLAAFYRPSTFAEVVEQNVSSMILQKQIETRQFSNSILLAGSSGCGKTTLARLFAKAINQGEGEPIEMDCASHNGADDVRAIMEESNQRALDAEYKVFILDEAHMFSKQAWDAFLKGIEEPSPYTIYIFCTTEVQKIPKTILSRLQRFNIAKISTQGIINRLNYICEKEGFTYYPDTIDFIAKYADGGMREAISALELCANYSTDLTLQNVKTVLGDLTCEVMNQLTYDLGTGNEKGIISLFDKLYRDGSDLDVFIGNYLSFVLDVNKYLLFKDLSLTNIPKYLEASLRNTIMSCGGTMQLAMEFLKKLVDQINDLKFRIYHDNSAKTTIEVELIKICRR